jgi:hypothetical protein
VPDVRAHLLNLAFNQAYPEDKRRAGDRQWLRWLAANMGEDRNLRWWQIPSWTPAWRQQTAISLVVGVALGFALGVALSPPGATVGAVLGIVRARFLWPPKTSIARWKPRRPTSTELGRGAALGIGVGGCNLFLMPLLGLWVACTAGVFLALQTVMTFLITHVWSAPMDDEDDLTMAESRAAVRRSYQLAGLTFGLGIALSNALWTGGAYAYLISNDGAVAAGVTMGTTVGIAAALPLLLTPSLAACQLCFFLTGRRVNFTTLLREAHQRKILTQTGSLYQFRYPELQDELRM